MVRVKKYKKREAKPPIRKVDWWRTNSDLNTYGRVYYEQKVDRTGIELGTNTFLDEEIMVAIYDAAARGCNYKEIALRAGIGRSTLYKMCKEKPDFRERLEELKNNPSLAARYNVTDQIFSGDVDTSKWYLERVNKDEFSTKSEVVGSGGPIQVVWGDAEVVDMDDKPQKLEEKPIGGLEEAIKEKEEINIISQK